ncbi:MAG: hypothetical protein NDI82_13525 [Anaeromyxobacteraceae bacterium]|nr:hypothetical protein [Anaeromyxobacteraceae bacterium]
MADTYTWLDRGGERVFYLDDPARPGARYLAVRRGAGDEDWSAACRLSAGGPVEEIGDGLVAASVAEDVILKYAIQALAHRHGVSPAPGLPGQEAGEVEVVIMRLWQALTARWAPPGGGGGAGPAGEG